MGKVVWKGPAARAAIVAGVRKNLAAASIFLRDQIKDDVSQSGVFASKRVNIYGKNNKINQTRNKNVYNYKHSLPGNPPFKQSGRLRASLTYEVTGLTARVGTNVPYGKFLELGTKRLAARPYLRAALVKHQTSLRLILTKRIAAGGLPLSSPASGRGFKLGAGANAAAGLLARGARQI